MYNDRVLYNLTHPQKRIWYSEKLYPDTSAHNLVIGLKIKDIHSVEKLQLAVNMLCEHNDSLRLRFTETDNLPKQYIEDYEVFDINVFDFSDSTKEYLHQKEIKRIASRVMELYDSPLYFFAVFILPENTVELIVKTHHIVSDVWSWGIMSQQILDSYLALESNSNPERKTLHSYLHFLKIEEKYKQSTKFKDDKRYWEDKFKNLPLSIESYQAKKNDVIESKRSSFELSNEDSSKVREICSKYQASVFRVFLVALCVYKYRVTHAKRIVLGAPLHNRFDDNLQEIVGMFVSTIPLCIDIEDDMSFEKLMRVVGDEVRGVKKHQAYPFDLLINDLHQKNLGIDSINLFDTLLSYQKAQYHEKITEVKWHHHSADSYPLILHVSERGTDSNLLIEFDYQLDEYTNAGIESMYHCMMNIINQIAVEPKCLLYNFEMVVKGEKNKILLDFNNTRIDYASNQTIPGLFDTVVQQKPNFHAAVYNNIVLTYKELQEKANNLASFLLMNSVKVNEPVVIFLDRSLEFIVCAIGILKARAAYLPIDIKYPTDRINHLLTDSNARIIITDRQLSEKLAGVSQQLVVFEDIIESSNIQTLSYGEPDDLSYIMYTSGSTGKPKGVMVTHKNVIRLVNNNLFIDLEPNERILQTGAPVFDATTFEIWASLLNGGTLYMTNDYALLDAAELGKVLLENKITTLWLTSPLFNQLVEQDIAIFKNLKKLLVGGDVLSPKHINKVREHHKGLQVINGYGPTENTTFSTTFSIDKTYNKNIPIGKPISNSTAYVLDSHLNLMPIGEIGELYVGGDGVAKGYLNNEELTRERFILNPFVEGDILYKTGDRVRWLPDGNIEFHGRVDFQVKIRGYRIEINEIENVLLSHPKVNEAQIIVVESNGQKELCAYYVLSESVSEDVLVSYLSASLPTYMIPAFFVEIDIFPLNQNGKIDRHKLPLPAQKYTSKDNKTLPETETQLKLSKIWKDVLCISFVGIGDDFFLMGGHSLRAMILVSKIKQVFSCELSLFDVFESRTLKLMAECIEKKAKTKYIPIEKVSFKQYYPVSSAQKRLLIIHQLEGNNTAFNIPIIINISGKFNYKRAWRALLRLINNHESLRTSFTIKDGQPYQYVHEKVTPKIEFIDADNDTNIKSEIDRFVRPFELSQAPLLRIGLIKQSGEHHILMIDMHHIIADGMSVSILKKEFLKLYSGERVAERKIQYKDFAAWQNRLFESNSIDNQLEYWNGELKGELPVLNLPIDFKRPARQSFSGNEYKFEIAGELFEKINGLCVQTSSTPYMLLLAAYNVLLHKYTGQTDIIVGTPVAGRNHSQVQETVGIFINSICLRNSPLPNMPFDEFLSEVRLKSLKAIENQDYQFEEIVTHLKLSRDLSRHPIFDTMFVVQEEPLQAFEMDGIEASSYNYNYKTAKLDLLLEAFPYDHKILFNVNYSNVLFKKGSIIRMFKHYVTILEAITANSKSKLTEINILSPEEVIEITEQFNDTYTLPEPHQTINELLYKQAKTTPDAVAISFEGKNFTFSEIDKKSNQLARLLRKKNVKPDTLIAIMLKRSPEMIISLMAILKSGAAYLPVDLDFPEDRINYMLEKGKAQIAITSRNLTNKLEAVDSIFVEDFDMLNSFDASPVENVNKPSDLAYVIFTSGSTGNPKGVMIEHGNVVNFIMGINHIIPFTSEKTILNLTTISFDIFVLETLIPLCTGAKMVLAVETHQKNSQLLNKLILNSGVNMLQITPSRLQLLLIDSDSKKSLSKIKEIMVGGEAFPESLLSELKSFENLRIFNMFGPTETTVWSTVKDLTNEENITIGTPIANTQIYIFDSNKCLQPINVSGELYIGGLGVARGYWEDTALTIDKFSTNPYRVAERLYRTGDIAKILPGGEVYFLGRADQQVKIRGYRIELGEVENVLAKCTGIEDVTVVAHDDGQGFKQLVGYYTAATEISITEIRTQMGRMVPEYMIPSLLIKLDKFPTTPNGKIDKKALPKPDNYKQTAQKEFAAPSTEVQKQLAEAWMKVLRREDICIHDNFFELGGNSLSLVMMHNLIHNDFPKIDVADIFANPTICKLTELVERNEISKQSVTPLSIELPSEFFTTGSDNKSSQFSYILSSEMQNAIHKISNTYHCEFQEILFSIFIYLQMKISGSTILNTHLYDKEGIIPIELHMQNVKDFSDIFLLVSEYTGTDKNESWTMNDFKDTIVAVDKKNVRTMFSLISENIVGLNRIFELIICLNKQSNGLNLTLYASSKLHSRSVEKLFKNYINILNLVTNKTHTKEHTI